MNATSGSRVAIPYYVFLMRPGGGSERVFFLIDLDEERTAAGPARMRVWNPRNQADLSQWLRQQGVDLVVCTQCPPALRRDLQAAGVRVVDRHRGELDDALRSCLEKVAA